MGNKKECILNNGQINQLNTLVNSGKIISSEDALKDVEPYIEINFNPDNIDTDKIIEEIIKSLNRQ